MSYEMKTLGTVAQYINGRAFKPDEWEEKGIPIIRIQNLNNTNAKYNYSSKTYEDKYLVKKGDLLFAWSASLGAHIWKSGNAWLNQHIFKVIPNDGIDRDYLYYYLLKVVTELYQKAHGTGMVHITKKPFMATPIPVPELKKQKQIVKQIEESLSQLDSAVETLKKTKQQLEVYRQAVLKEAFYGSNKVTQKSCKISDFADVGTGATPLRSNKEYYSGSIPWVTSAKINDKKIYSPTEYITEKALKETNCKLYPPHTLLVAMYGEGKTRGKCAELMITAATNQALAVIEIKDKSIVMKDFLKWYLIYNYGNIRLKSSGGVQPNINLSIIKNIRVPLLSISEQKQTIIDIDEKMTVCDSIERTVSQSLQQAEALRQSILKQAFEG